MSMSPPTSTDRTLASGPQRHARMRRLAVFGTVAAAGIAFAACGGSSGASTTSSTGSSDAGAPSGSSSPPSSVPGANGTIASVSGSSLEVQNSQTGQTTVTWTPTTTLRQITSTTAGAVTVGSCITAVGTPTSGSSSSSPFGGPVTATTVSVSQPTNGSCSRGAGDFRPGGGPGGRPPGSGTNGTRPSGSFRPPSGRFRANFATGSGMVTAVTGSAITIDETNPRTSGTTTVTVTVTGSTTYSTTVTATSAAVVVGQCARAVGTADSTGAVTAQTLTISAPTNGTCSSGFGGGFGGGGGFGAPGAAAGA